MARIAKAEHDKIRAMVDVEGRKVTEVAATYGCSAANIYAILKAVRALDVPRPPAETESTQPSEATERPAVIPVQAIPAPAGDLFEALPPFPTAPVVNMPGSEIVPRSPTPRSRARTVPPSSSEPTSKPRVAPASPAPPRAKGGKAGYALLMRTSDGEEAVHPFRSLEELLASAKPILRTAARSPEPIWFSIQAIDLDSLADEDF